MQAKESARLASKYGLRESSKTGLSTGVLKGTNGQVAGFVEFARGPGSLLTNPAFLASAAGIMAQLAMQQTMDEIIDYLATIDKKVDDVLRAQKDAVVADMIGVDLVIEEAMTIREQVGWVSEPQHAMLALQAVCPGDDPVHQAAQAVHVHGSSLPGHPPSGCHHEDAHTYSRRAPEQSPSTMDGSHTK